MGEVSDFMKKYLSQPRYCLSDYDDETIRAAREMLKDKIIAVVNEVAGDKADQLIAQLLDTSFAEDDTLNMNFEFATNGTDFLSMLGRAKLEAEAKREAARKNCIFNHVSETFFRCPKNCDCNKD